MKKVITKIFSFLLISTLALNVYGAQKQYKYDTIPNDPLKARIYTLDNGLKVYMTVYKNAPRIQTEIVTKAGSKNDPSDATGLAHYFEHMMFKGSSNLGTLDFAKEKPMVEKIDSLFEVYRAVKVEEKDKRKKIYHVIDSISFEASKYAVSNEYFKITADLGFSGTNAWTFYDNTAFINDIPSNQLENWLIIESDRFSDPVLRLFHTELETVYEERNMYSTTDDEKINETMFKELFKKHSYGISVIGKGEHLKNPSMKRIREFYSTYYVPNNMAICLSGDFDPDYAIALIDKYFGSFKRKDVPLLTFEKEEPITKPIVKEIKGPDAESVTLAFRFGGATSKDADMLSLINMMLSNNTAGLIDLNLIQKQKVLSAYSYPLILSDYSIEIIEGKPKTNQSLEEVKDLLLSQIELIKKGEFPDWLLPAIVNNLKLYQVKQYENNSSRAMAFVETFASGVSWSDEVNKFNRLSKITKEDIIKFANEKFNDNYVAIYKKTGKDDNVEKIQKPKITTIKTNANEKSEFLQKIEAKKVTDIEPVFLDFEKDIQKFNIKENIPVYYINNSENQTFSMYYVFEMGTDNNKKLGIALEYLKYLGTSKYSPAEIQQEFFKLGTSFWVYTSAEQIWVCLDGLSENMEKAVALFEGLLADPKPNKEALDNLVKDVLKKRADDKLDPQSIFSRLTAYGTYGPISSETNILSEKELKNLAPEELVATISELNSFEHYVFFYGSLSKNLVSSLLTQYHKTPTTLKVVPPATKFTELDITKNKVYSINRDMKQAWIVMLSKNDGPYNKDLAPIISLYDEYISTISFQELREAKALAYYAGSYYVEPYRKEKAYHNISIIMTQADKLGDAMIGLTDLLNNMPETEKTFEMSKNSIIQRMRTERITKADILFTYEEMEKLGVNYDIRKDIFNKVPSLTMQDLKAFQADYIKNKAQTSLIMGDKKLLDFKTLKKYGIVKKLKLEDVFGY